MTTEPTRGRRRSPIRDRASYARRKYVEPLPQDALAGVAEKPASPAIVDEMGRTVTCEDLARRYLMDRPRSAELS